MVLVSFYLLMADVLTVMYSFCCLLCRDSLCIMKMEMGALIKSNWSWNEIFLEQIMLFLHVAGIV